MQCKYIVLAVAEGWHIVIVDIVHIREDASILKYYNYNIHLWRSKVEILI